MKILVTGKGKSGAWKIRGEQLGSAMGATVQGGEADVRGFDAVVLVKRPQPGVVESVHAAGVPLVWDVVDAYPQPGSHGWERDVCMRWLRESIAEIRPAAIVAATRCMAEDCAEFGVPVLALPHHARPGLVENPIRERVRLVGYEGEVKHLGSWLARLYAECKRRRWDFVVSPEGLSDLDIVVAMRESKGYAARNWKSNVKLANAQGSGTPCVLNRERGYRETACGAERWAETNEELRVAFDSLTSHEARRAAADRLRVATIPVEAIAKEYRGWIETVCKTAPRS